MTNGNELEEVVVTLSGDLIMLDWKGQERLIRLKDLVDTFKVDMTIQRVRSDTDTDLIDSINESFCQKLSDVAEYSKNISVDRNITLN